MYAGLPQLASRIHGSSPDMLATTGGEGQRFGLIDISGGRVYWWGTKNMPVRTGTRLARR